MRFLVILLALTLAACGDSPSESRGGAVTGPSVTVICNPQAVAISGGGSVGDTNVDVDCPKDSQNPVTTSEVSVR